MAHADRIGRLLAACGMMFLASPASANSTAIVDLTAGTATNDGNVSPGEYVGSSAGINSGFGDQIGATSRLHVDSDAGGNLNFGITSGNNPVSYFVVVYFDSIPGGSATTASFNDSLDSSRQAASGTNGTTAAVLQFAPGFEADFALVIDSSSALLFRLTELGPHVFVALPTFNMSPLEIEVSGLTTADLGLDPGDSFDYIATLLNPAAAFRSNEFQGVAQSTVGSTNPGSSAVSLASGDSNRFTTFSDAEPVPLTGPIAGAFLVASLMSLGAYANRRRHSGNAGSPGAADPPEDRETGAAE